MIDLTYCKNFNITINCPQMPAEKADLRAITILLVLTLIIRLKIYSAQNLSDLFVNDKPEF